MQISELENLFINNESYQRLSSLMNRFNPIKVMGMERMEIRHSAILAWLLDPSENHHLGDSVLRAFISEALKGQSETAINALDVLTAGLSNAVVYREWQNIDIVVAEPDLGWVFVVENKVGSSQHSNQLERYMRVVEENLNLLMESAPGKDADHASPKIQGVYLTLDSEDPKDNRYVAMDHVSINDILKPIILDNQDRIATPVSDFIQYYIEVINEMTGSAENDNEMERLAKKLYKENRRIIDFIVENGSQTALDLALAEFSDKENLEHGDRLKIGGTDLIVEKLGKRYVSMMPEQWIQSFGGYRLGNPQRDEYLWRGCENWRLPFPVGLWFEIRDSNSNGKKSYELRIAAEIGPLMDGDERRDLIGCLRDSLNDSEAQRSGSRKWFQSKAEKEGAKYSRFYTAKIKVEEADDIPEIKAAILSAWDDISQIIDPVDKGIQKFMTQNHAMLSSG